jgi:hypothetical protein
VEAVGLPTPDWGHWGYSGTVLPAGFHNRTGPRSFANVLSWVKGNPLAAFQGKSARYCRVEKTLLVLGLTLRELDRVLFTEEADSLAHTEYLKNSPLMLKYLDKAVEGCNALLRKISIPAGPRSVFGVSSRVYFC